MFIKGALSSFWRVFEFYRQGFSAMRLGKTLWGMIFVKLFVIFVLLKIFVFDENLNSTFAKDADKSDFVLRNLINPANSGVNSAILNENSINSRTNSNSAQTSKQNQTNSQNIQATLDEIQTNSANSQEIQALSHKNAAKIHKEQTKESKINTLNSKQKDTR